jgi:hypothetical protein
MLNSMKPFFLGLLLLPTLAIAFEPLNTDDAGTVRAGGNQIEQYFFVINRSGGAEASDILTPGEEYSGNTDARAFPFTYTRGLSETLEASFSSTYYNQPSGNFSKIANYVLATKWRFHEDTENGYAMAIKPTVVLPASKQQQVNGLGLAAVNYGLNFITSKYWDDVELHINATYMRSPYNTNYSIGHTADNSRINIFLVSIAPVWTVSRNFKLALDIGATTNPPSSEQYLAHYALIAGIYSLTENLDLGISYMRTGMNYGETFAVQQAGATRSEIGITWRF